MGLEMVKDNHEEFLASLDPPIKADRNLLTSWHKDFDVDAAPEVDTVELPEEPGKVAVDALAKEVSEKAKKLAEINPKLSNVLRDSSVKAEKAAAKKELKKAVGTKSADGAKKVASKTVGAKKVAKKSAKKIAKQSLKQSAEKGKGLKLMKKALKKGNAKAKKTVAAAK